MPNIVRQFRRIPEFGSDGMTVFFSTYQSIEVVSAAQKQLGICFDLIICDEAHRTTGVTLAGSDESAFVRVHDESFLSGKKRLYMTATPRIFSDSSKKKADEHNVLLCSMDDERLYGSEMYRLGFGEAVEKRLLVDYKVLVLTLSEKDISPSVQRLVANLDKSINADDAAKLVGCINALSKKIVGDDGVVAAADPAPMRRAVAFCSTIRASKDICHYLNEVFARYRDDLMQANRQGLVGSMVNVTADHIDGSMGALKRDELLSWLKAEESDSSTCRILTNVRCLSEGVDVPSLDAVLFLSARDSQVDVVQSVGRVMRRSPGKKYGYIVIPVVVPSSVAPEKILENTEFRVVWAVLNALHAHDDRFSVMINKLELNRKKPENILIGESPVKFDEDGEIVYIESGGNAAVQGSLQREFEELKGLIFARMVMKVGDRQYWENWAKDVVTIAEMQRARIEQLIKTDEVAEKFRSFVLGLQEIIHPSISAAEAIDMLSQHLITKPVFEALFENYSFVSHNPVSMSMQKMIEVFEAHAFQKEMEKLEKFYASVRKRVENIEIDNADGRQRIILELYEKFFKIAFPQMTEQLGIVYTPIEVVDFILHSVDDVLKKEFGRGLTDENVHILDPFTGTGTFITCLLQSGLITKEDLPRKYLGEIHANEIVLLAYYIAAINIETSYHSWFPAAEMGYQAFQGICLTDTFQLSESDEREHLISEFFERNSEQVNRQKNAPITVILGNPPYSVGQNAANDNAQNIFYPKLETRIKKTYAKDSTATNKNALYDSYIKAFRWASDRLEKKQGGIIGFVSNGGWIDGNAMDGLRKHLHTEFSSIYVLNLRGNQRTSEELSKKEGGKIFGSSSRSSIAITLLVKDTKKTTGKAQIFYCDIGDYLSREQKLAKLKEWRSVDAISWETLTPNQDGDWINQRFSTYIPIGDKFGKKAEDAYFVPRYSRGLVTGRDAWCYNSSKPALIQNIQRSMAFYHSQVEDFQKQKSRNPHATIEESIKYDSTQFSWDMQQKTDLARGKKYGFEATSVRIGLYRPFFKQQVYFNRQLNNSVFLLPSLFPTSDTENRAICVSAPGTSKDFSVLIVDQIPDLHFVGDSQCFPLYYYDNSAKEKRDLDAGQASLFTAQNPASEQNYQRKEGISDFILDKAKKQYQTAEIMKEDIFYYVYGILHSPEYRAAFSSDLKKMLPRIPLVDRFEDFHSFSEAGHKLADLHLYYEKVPPYSDVTVSGIEAGNFQVTKMRFSKKGQKDTITYNASITITEIPEKAYQYTISGKSAIEWIMDRYQITTDKDTRITNDPNTWAEEHGEPRYILDLLLRIIRVSIQTIDIVERLPRLRLNSEI